MDKKSIFTTSIKPDSLPYSPAIKANGFIFVSGQLPLNEKGEMPSDMAGQTHQVMRNISTLLEANGSSIDKIVKTTVFISDMSLFGVMNEVYVSYFKGDLPARSAVEVSKLAKGAMVEIDAIAVV
jgi:2-iminobutanoate/2-iminopropanoate deaminase